MPTYVYKFIDNGETIEVQQAFSDNALTEAVHPGSGATMPVKKVFLPVGVSFKGGGFYKTDSRGGSGSKSSNGTSSSSATSSSDTSSSGSPAESTSGGSKSNDSSSSSTPVPAKTPVPASSPSSD